jgi:hypothetical protein
MTDTNQEIADFLLGVELNQAIDRASKRVTNFFLQIRGSLNSSMEAYLAVTRGDDRYLSKLLETPEGRQSVLYKKPSSHNTALHKAAKRGFAVACTILICVDAPINEQNLKGEVISLIYNKLWFQFIILTSI